MDPNPPVSHNERNLEDKNMLRARLAAESETRVPVSFYVYSPISKPHLLRKKMWHACREHSILGRIYLAHEGVNAQISIPEKNASQLPAMLASLGLNDIPLKKGLVSSPSFLKLRIKVRPRILADGLPDNAIDFSKTGKHLSAHQWNKDMEDKNTVVVDCRNDYEWRIGHFEGAVLPKAATYREEIAQLPKLLHAHRHKKIRLYCTGGIRCEKASAYLATQGFSDVAQLSGGIIAYAHTVKKENLPCKFKGANYVFDERRFEPITNDVLDEKEIARLHAERSEELQELEQK